MHVIKKVFAEKVLTVQAPGQGEGRMYFLAVGDKG
jgi:hypothetical protein